MSSLSHKIDFAVIIGVKNANPNGDPLNGNRPRVTYEGFGELSDVCIKRKIRNRLLDSGQKIFVQSDDRKVDNYTSLRNRQKGELDKVDTKDEQKFREAACQMWFDVRAFGQVFAYSGGGETGVSIGIRGPVSIHPAFSIAPVLDRVTSLQITKSVSGEGDGTKRGSDTMGMKHRVDHGIYVFYGSINPQLAEKTGFSDEDALGIKEAIRTLFENDASSARPEGSMEVIRVYWWDHNNKHGQYSSAKVHKAISENIGLIDANREPNSIHDYMIPSKDLIDSMLPGLPCEIIEGM